MTDLTCQELIDLFKKDLKTRKKSLDTIRSYPITLKRFGKFMGGDIEVMTKNRLKEYLIFMQEKGLGQKTIRWNFTIIKEFYEWLLYEDYINTQIPMLIRSFTKRNLEVYKETESPRRSPSTEDVIKLIGGIQQARDLAFVVLLFKTGIRRKELSELDVSDIDLDDMTVTLKETAKRSNRVVYFDAETAYVLRRWLRQRKLVVKGNEPALFLSRDGTRLQRESIDQLFRKNAIASGLCQKGDEIGKALTPHSARHWFTSILLESGMSPQRVAFLRGDKGQQSQDIYHHIDKKKLKEEYERCMPNFGLYRGRVPEGNAELDESDLILSMKHKLKISGRSNE
jgi:integrase/recombinase XerD